MAKLSRSIHRAVILAGTLALFLLAIGVLIGSPSQSIVSAAPDLTQTPSPTPVTGEDHFVFLPYVSKPLPPPCEEPVVSVYRTKDVDNVQTLYIWFYIEKCPGTLDIHSSRADLAHRVGNYPSLIYWENPNSAWWDLNDDYYPLCHGDGNIKPVNVSHELIIKNNIQETVDVKLRAYGGEVLWEGYYEVVTDPPPASGIPPKSCIVP